MSEQKNDERRWRLVAVQEIDLLSLFRDYDVFRFPRFTNVPDGFKVIGVEHSFQHRAFRFCIEHPSFSPVEFGQEIPTLAAVEMVTIKAPAQRNQTPEVVAILTDAPCELHNARAALTASILSSARKGKWEFLGAP